jgi:hypothetical protein
LRSADRDQLIHKVRRGEISPEAAEDEARRLGGPALASKPDPQRFDPIKKEWWSLPMAVAWIAWRSAEDVRDFWDEYRARCWDWQPLYRFEAGEPTCEGYELRLRAPATPLLLTIHAEEDALAGALSGASFFYGVSVVEDAKRSLWRALAEGLLEATAQDLKSTLRVTIPSHEWADLDWEEQNGSDPVRLARKGVLGVSGYGAVKLRSAELVSLWPHMGPPLDTLPETVTPVGPGHITVFQAAQWIATKGGQVAFPPTDLAVWKDAYGQLLARAASNDLIVTGVREGERRAIESLLFVDLPVEYPFNNSPSQLRLSDDLFLRSYAYAGEEEWRAGFDDSLCNCKGAKWRKLMVVKTDILRWWPFSLKPPEQADAHARTGLPGRPSSWHLIEPEFLRRHQAGQALPSISKEAEHLATWLGKAHPTAPRAGAGSIANNLRVTHRDKFDP